MAELNTLGAYIRAGLVALVGNDRLPASAIRDLPASDVQSVNGQTGEVVIDIEDLGGAAAAALAAKADTAAVNTALAAKADTAAVNTALAAKADAATVTTALAGKADAGAMTTALAGKASTAALTALEGEVDAVTAEVAGKASTASVTALSGTVAAQATAIAGKADTGHVHAMADEAEARDGTEVLKPLTPGVLAEISGTNDIGSVSGNVSINLAAGPILRYQVAGPTHFSPGTLRQGSGLIKIRMLGPYAVTFDSAILRDVDDPTLAPDGRPWVETVYAWSVTDGRLEMQVARVQPIVAAAAPTLSDFGGLFDASAGNLRVGNSGSAISVLGDPVKYWPPVGFNPAYVSSGGASLSLPAANQPYASADTDELPTLVERLGRRGVLFSGAGDGLLGTHYGVIGAGVPNPVGTPAAPPYKSHVTMGLTVFTPDDLAAACPLMTMHRNENSNTGRWGIWLTAAGAPYLYSRLDSASPRQSGTTAEVAANTAVHAAESPNAVKGTWRLIIAQLRVDEVDTAADTTPPTATTRGTGAHLSLWVDNDPAKSIEVDISSYRGSNNLAWQFNRTVLGAAYSSTARQAGAPVTIGRAFFSLEDMEFGDPTYWALAAWLGAQ